MGWRRSCFEKEKSRENYAKALLEKGAKAEKFHKVSPNADNRHYCWGCCKEKYCYETKEKAEKAARFTENKQRVYYCELCSAYHTTSRLSLPNLKVISNGFNNMETLKEGGVGLSKY
ncbi:hypothetical protein IKD98_02035 [Candidatus Saccharibacteria bacterium]|nr:hypothetical protein [Candidatus Saccharibacteria bacterium]